MSRGFPRSQTGLGAILKAAMAKLLEFDTVLTADSVEWCPCAGFEHLLSCGTYQLEDGGRRRGSVIMAEWLQEKSELKQILQAETQKISDGVLDMKWYCGSHGPLLALACSNGSVAVLRLEQTPTGELLLCEAARTMVAAKDDKTGLSLSLDWCKQQSQPVLAVSDSIGRVSTVEVTDSGARVLHGWQAHEFEAWIAAFGHQPYMVYSGGDDCKLRVWDLRTGLIKPSFTIKRYQMGVCSLQIHPRQEHILAAGSYDETLVTWDTRNMAAPLKEVGLGGGVWRVKWHPIHPDLITTACMHNGFHVVNCHLQTGEPMEVFCSYKEHSSLAYGVDWCQSVAMPTADNGHSALLASCSFYDHSMHLWTTPPSPLQ